MRVGVMGGTFNPIHNGHLIAAQEALNTFGLDEVVFVPTGAPWQKEGKLVASAEERYLMTVIATASNPRFGVSRVEIDRHGPTYTVDTLRTLHAQRPSADLYFITGADAILQILTWKDPDEVLDLATFIAVTRPGHDLAQLEVLGPQIRDRVMTLHIPGLAISSTEIRDRIRRGQPIRYLVPAAVSTYIEKAGLYR